MTLAGEMKSNALGLLSHRWEKSHDPKVPSNRDLVLSDHRNIPKSGRTFLAAFPHFSVSGYEVQGSSKQTACLSVNTVSKRSQSRVSVRNSLEPTEPQNSPVCLQEQG